MTSEKRPEGYPSTPQEIAWEEAKSKASASAWGEAGDPNARPAELPVDYRVERISEQANKEQEREEISRIGCALITLIMIVLTFMGASAKEWFPS